MGGRGSLSSNKHKMYNVDTIKSEMKKSGVRVLGTNNISRKGLSLVVDALETVQHLNRRYGKNIDTVAIGLKRKSDFSYNENLKMKRKDGSVVNYGRTLIIPKDTVAVGRKQMLKEVKMANKDKFVVATNIRQMVAHEYGHAMHHTLRVKNPTAYKKLEKEFNSKLKYGDAKIKLSTYASTKTYNGKVSSHEYVAEAMTHLIRGTTNRNSKDMIDLVRKHMETLPNVKFPQPRKPKKTIKRRPKKR